MSGHEGRRFGQPLTRRYVLALGGAAAVWVTTGCRGELAGSDPLSSASTTNSTVAAGPIGLPAASTDNNDHVLVVVQLLGGNDGLNTLVPSDGSYRDARPSLALPLPDVLRLTDDFGLHPALAPLLPLWQSGAMAAAAGVGFDQQDRSHFTSRDIWWRGGDDRAGDGWLARWIEAAAIDDPDEPMEALALGVGARALAGSSASTVSDPTDVGFTPPGDMSQGDYESFLLSLSQTTPNEVALLAAARRALPAALSTQKILTDTINAGSAGDNAGDAYLDRQEPAMSLQLNAAAELIKTRPGLRVVTVGVEGYDTHANQSGTHAGLLETLARSLVDFWDALGPAHQQRTLLMTTSEFGHQVAENGSAGTDHGRGGAQLILGGGVAGGQVVGTYGLDKTVDNAVPLVVPELDVYADALRWLGGPVADVLGTDRPATGLLTT